MCLPQLLAGKAAYTSLLHSHIGVFLCSPDAGGDARHLCLAVRMSSITGHQPVNISNEGGRVGQQAGTINVSGDNIVK
jgi:hypothetical protein